MHTRLDAPGSQTQQGKAMASTRIVEEEHGVYTAELRWHNGYWAGDFFVDEAVPSTTDPTC